MQNGNKGKKNTFDNAQIFVAFSEKLNLTVGQFDHAV